MLTTNEKRRMNEKQTRQKIIIETAERVFSQKGFHNATIDDIALEAGFSRRTVYQYFVNKEDLFFAAAVSAFEYLLSDFEKAGKEGRSGWDKLLAAGYAYAAFYDKEPALFKLLSEVQSIKTFEEGSVWHQKIMEIEGKMFHCFTGLVIQGKLDKSISDNADPLQAAYYLVGSTISFFSSLAVGYDRIEKSMGIDLSGFMRQSVFWYCKGLQNHRL